MSKRPPRSARPRSRRAGNRRFDCIPWAALADIRDEIDAQVLPIFLEEAAELFPRAGDELRAWRRAPDDMATANRLRRTLHTFKGSARNLGEATYEGYKRVVATDRRRYIEFPMCTGGFQKITHVAIGDDEKCLGLAKLLVPLFVTAGIALRVKVRGRLKK